MLVWESSAVMEQYDRIASIIHSGDLPPHLPRPRPTVSPLLTSSSGMCARCIVLVPLVSGAAYDRRGVVFTATRDVSGDRSPTAPTKLAAIDDVYSTSPCTMTLAARIDEASIGSAS